VQYRIWWYSLGMAIDTFDGQKLKALRKRARLTQMQVVAMAQVSETTICYIERGERKPQARTLQKLLTLYTQRLTYWRQLAERAEQESVALAELQQRAKERNE